MDTDHKTGEPFLVYYKDGVYDLTQFAHKHPGGRNTLDGLRNRDIEKRLQAAPPHSDAAMYLMKEYKVSDQVPSPSPNTKDTDLNNNNDTNNTDCDDKDTIVATKTGPPTDDLKSEFLEKSDDSMEHLVDWSAAMVPQIGRLGPTYVEWVNKPVDRPLRLFANDWIEMLTKTPWWVVPAFWAPAIMLIARSGVQLASGRGVENQEMVVSFVAGLLLWTILEYALHRWVFHLDTKGAGVALCTFHFLLHGLHHKVPFDPNRLVFPPVPAMFLAWIFYLPLALACSCPRIVLAGGLLGYLCYDMVHYYIHYGSPVGDSYLYNMKRYHYQHHFVHHDQGFGITSPVWDDMFGTRILLRKLQYYLKW